MSEELNSFNTQGDGGNTQPLQTEQPIEPQLAQENIQPQQTAQPQTVQENVQPQDMQGDADTAQAETNRDNTATTESAESNTAPQRDNPPMPDSAFLPQNGQPYYNNPQVSPFSGSPQYGTYPQQNMNGYGAYRPLSNPFGGQNNQPLSGGQYAGAMPQNNAPQNPYAQASDRVVAPQYGTVNFELKPKEKKSMPAGLIIFLVTAFIVLVVCICLTVIAVSRSSSDSGKDSDVFSYNYQQPTSGYQFGAQPSTESDDALEKSDLVDTTDKNGPQIELKNQPRDILDGEKYTAKYAYDKAEDSVVGVIGYTTQSKEKIGSQGTGIIISENGYIVTNSHVIGDSKTKYKVTVSIDGQEYDAQVTGYDSRTDIAVLKIDKTGLTPAEFADSAEVSVGQEVVAIGNPGGIDFSNSLTQGIVSALDRNVSHGNVSYIQTDAAINPGNSGGPLLNMSGQVIGITTVKIVNTSYEGMGFAIPSQQAVSVIDSIIKQGYVEGRVRIGLTGNEINSTYSSYYGIPVGVYVVSVDETGPLADSDVEPGDVITKIDDVDITSFSVLYKELDKHKPGDVVTLTYQSVDDAETEYTEHTVEVTLAADSSAE